MKKSLIVLLVLLVGMVPVVSAQKEEEIPAGCNIAALGEIFTLVGDSLESNDMTLEQSNAMISLFQVALEDTHTVCSGESLMAEGAMDYSDIPQSRTEDGAFVLGEPDAPVTIIEFADFLCPHCQDYHATVQEFISEYVVTGQARFEFRAFPVIDQRLSPLMAQLAECAATMDAGSNFWEAHDVLFDLAAESGFTALTPFLFATRTGLDYDEVLSCVDTKEQVETDAAFGQELGISGTPGLRVRFGDGDAEIISIDGTEYDRGALPIELLASVVESAQE